MCLLQTFEIPNSGDQTQYDDKNNMFQTLCLTSQSMASIFQTMFAQLLHWDVHYKTTHITHVVLCPTNVLYDVHIDQVQSYA